MKKLIIILAVVFIAVYLLGPKPARPVLNKDLPSIGTGLANINEYVRNKDEDLPLKHDNEARIIWANDSIKERTDYCLLYLHGFSASWYEGYPANAAFAKKYGMNAYFPRLASHGLLSEDPLIDMTPDRLWESAKEALMVANNLGRKVIIMGTSTGGTLALKLAADFPEYVDALILYSPNVAINNSAAFLLSRPWGLQIGRKFNGGKYRVTEPDSLSKVCMYWNCRYRMEAVVYLQQLIEATMTEETFSNVTLPVFLGYYYKDDANQDQTVRVDAMLEMFDQLGTSPELKMKVAFPDAGDHVIANELTSGSVNEVIEETSRFAEEILKIKQVTRTGNYSMPDAAASSMYQMVFP